MLHRLERIDARRDLHLGLPHELDGAGRAREILGEEVVRDSEGVEVVQLGRDLLELLGELAGLVGRYRTHEGLHAHLMLALYRSGRRGEAIDVYRRMRTGLVNELGLEPSPSLRRLQHAMLMSDRRLAEVGTEAAALDRTG